MLKKSLRNSRFVFSVSENLFCNETSHWKKDGPVTLFRATAPGRAPAGPLNANAEALGWLSGKL